MSYSIANSICNSIGHKKYLFVRKILYFPTYLFLLPIVLPIVLPSVLPIELPINRFGGQGPGPGPLGPGAWGPLGPRCGIRVENVTTYCQAGYLLSGKLPTVRQSYLQSGKLPTVRQSYLQSGKATYSQACTQQPHTCTQPSHRHAPKRHRHAPKSIHRLAPNFRILCTQWGGVNFQKVQYSIVVEIKSQSHI